MISASERKRILDYYNEIARMTERHGSRKASLSLFLKHLFSRAHQQSLEGGDPVAENQALIISLSLFTIGRSPVTLFSQLDRGSMLQTGNVKVTLLGRNDLPKHYMLSAVIAATADSNLSALVGVFKEIEDSKGGTGFSFPDLAADKAGVRLAQMATSSTHTASELQHRMLTVMYESEFMPSVDQLPEGLMEMDFKREFGELNSMKYQKVTKEIKKRMAACGVLAPVN